MFHKIIRRSKRKDGKSDTGLGHKQSSRKYGVGSAWKHGMTPKILSQKRPGTSSVTQGQQPQETFEYLPMLRDATVSQRQNLFVRKLDICCFQFDFSDTTKMSREKDIKRHTLVDLVDYVQFGGGKFSEENQEKLMKMISLNIFRCLPPASYENTGTRVIDPDEEEDPNFDPSWLHLQLVYELLLRYVISPDTDIKVAKLYIDNSFVLKLLELFDSEDPREREYLKTILHRIYGKFMAHRPFIRKAINHIFYRFIHETRRHNGIAELLEILGSIINGFALPMKEEHLLFLVRALIPLHKPKSSAVYHQQLSYCITQFVEKDYTLADTVILGMLKYWPVSNSQKEVLFLSELEQVLEAIENEEFQNCVVPLFTQIARCLNSHHFQVAERALSLWNNEEIGRLIWQNRYTILPIIFEGMEKNIHSHWKESVREQSINVLKMYLEEDVELFRECHRLNEDKAERLAVLGEEREIRWQILEAAAAQG